MIAPILPGPGPRPGRDRDLNWANSLAGVKVKATAKPRGVGQFGKHLYGDFWKTLALASLTRITHKPPTAMCRPPPPPRPPRPPPVVVDFADVVVVVVPGGVLDCGAVYCRQLTTLCSAVGPPTSSTLCQMALISLTV